jgi:hypothetical protein
MCLSGRKTGLGEISIGFTSSRLGLRTVEIPDRGYAGGKRQIDSCKG